MVTALTPLLPHRWIDACMRQLKHEGWIHHLARHSVACFLTRGQCYISWERGMEVFDGESELCVALELMRLQSG